MKVKQFLLDAEEFYQRTFAFRRKSKLNQKIATRHCLVFTRLVVGTSTNNNTN